jgi:hypothetical protein
MGENAVFTLVFGIGRNVRQLRGKVVTGLGNFGQWIDRLSSLYEQKPGCACIPEL